MNTVTISKRDQYLISGMLIDLSKGEVTQTPHNMAKLTDLNLADYIDDKSVVNPGKGRRPRKFVVSAGGSLFLDLLAKNYAFAEALSVVQRFQTAHDLGVGAIVRGLMADARPIADAIEAAVMYGTAISLGITHTKASVAFGDDKTAIGRLKAEIKRKTPVVVEEVKTEDTKEFDAADPNKTVQPEDEIPTVSPEMVPTSAETSPQVSA